MLIYSEIQCINRRFLQHVMRQSLGLRPAAPRSIPSAQASACLISIERRCGSAGNVPVKLTASLSSRSASSSTAPHQGSLSSESLSFMPPIVGTIFEIWKGLISLHLRALAFKPLIDGVSQAGRNSGHGFGIIRLAENSSTSGKFSNALSGVRLYLTVKEFG
jgi:hypothetical protein